jgi:SNF2 family DNA or RNA helicase
MVRGLLVVTLLRPMYKVWSDAPDSEIAEWKLGWRSHLLHKKGKREDALDNEADVYVINYEGLEWLLDLVEANPKLKLPFDMIVFDESSKLRNTNTQRFKIVRKLIGYFKRRYILTGSPTPKSLMNLFGQIYSLDAGERLGKYITHYRMKYFDATPIGAFGPVAWDLKEGAAEQIYDKIKDVVIRFDDSQLDMPKLVPRNIDVELPRQARSIYNDLERDLITAIDANIIVAKNAGVATQKLRQVANGGLYYNANDERRWKKLHDAKTDALLELIDGLEGQAALVSYEFHHDLERLRAALPKNTPWVGGGVSLKRQFEIIDEWNRGNIEVLLGNPASMAHGLNMQKGPGRAVIFHSLVWDYEAYDQFIRRIRRQGQKAKRVFLYHIVAKNTVDHAVLESMAVKGATQQHLFNAFKAAVEKEVMWIET